MWDASRSRETPDQPRAPSGPEPDPGSPEWQPTADLELLAFRARLLGRLRDWFRSQGVMEVETPVLSAAAATDPALDSLATTVNDRVHYLHTSPEFPMKRLLAAGTGDIYQVCRVFRDGEHGRLHNPEFTMLEFYRLGYDEHRLMEEVDALVRHLMEDNLVLSSTVRTSHADALREHAGVDVHTDPAALLAARLDEAGIEVPESVANDRDALLDLLLATVVLPCFDPAAPTFLYDFPASQAALARIRPGPPAVAARFELFLGGMEVANGFHELCDAAEQASRFARDRELRRARGRTCPPEDRRLLAALASGLPDCAGVAIGFDRLLLCASRRERIAEVMSFDIASA